MSDDTVNIAVEQMESVGAVVVSPEGDIDMSRSPELRTALRRVLDQNPGHLVVDLSGVSYMDSSGLATLVEAMRTSKAASGRMVLCGLSKKVKAIFEIAKLHQFFEIAEDRGDALPVS